ncbi:hypothetical protein G7Y89_g13483 [Cudoniella acicularis]|uniref:Serine hydrolase domain-containing protein n=1 Tax=Cudoniella acicularis TaxID=354080 RepID=A0A8H4R9J1_9HELO|nr:hypothetical protein G7Y89_g13483 [Cudoniella acicularis]
MARPRIACFHGGGSSSAIYSIQCDQVLNLLKEFEFVFFDAPFERDAGPGVLPAFADEIYRPYRTWFRNREDGTELNDGSGYAGPSDDGVERVWEMMKAKGKGGDWVGAMGFSQGTRVVGGLLLDQQRRKEAGLPLPKGMILKFGVLCMGGAAPMVSAMSRDGTGELDLISIPTFHLHGLKDHNLENGRKQLATYYDSKQTKLWEIDYHHAMPWFKEDVQGFVARFTEIAKDLKAIQ